MKKQTPSGPQGPQRPPGPDKGLEVTTVSNTETGVKSPDDNSFIVSSIAECPNGTNVSEGGYELSESLDLSSRDVIVLENMLFNNGWKVTAKVIGTNSIELTVHATCNKFVDSSQ